MYSDHSIVECATKYHPGNVQEAKKQKKYSPAASQFEKLNFFSEDDAWMGLNNELKDHNWSQEFWSADPDSRLRCFIDVCSAAASEYIPERKAFSKTSVKSRIPKEKKNLMRRRRRINSQLRKSTSEARRRKLKEEAKEVEKKLQSSYCQSRKNSEDKAIGAIKRNSKYFFSYAKKFSCVRTGVGPLIDATGKLVTCAKEMAEILTSQYRSVWSEPKEKLQEATELFPEEEIMTPGLWDIAFNEDDIMIAIDELSPSAAPGPDKFCWRTARRYCHSLCITYGESLSA